MRAAMSSLTPQTGGLWPTHPGLAAKWLAAFAAGACGRKWPTHIGHVACNQINGRYEREFAMTKVRVAGFSISLDGFGAGPEQSLENPLGKRGLELHQWKRQ
jgi:hypothetical protein